eukprot:2828689-Rhodomonas_salina.2
MSPTFARAAAVNSILVFILAVAASGSSAPPETPQRHPEDVLVWIQAENPIPVPFQQQMWKVGLGGLVEHVKYKYTIEVFSEGNLMSFDNFEAAKDPSEQDHVSVVAVPLPSLPGGVYTLNLVVYDSFPGLDEEDSFLAARKLQHEIIEPEKMVDSTDKNITCKEQKIWASHSSTDEADDGITLVSVASIDRALAALHLAARWDSSLSYTFYARNEEEEETFQAFVEKDL